MALPQLNATPKYTLTVPSTGEELRFRPYLVKEEKVLLIASSSEDMKTMMSAIYDTIEACVEGIDIEALTTFDLEYIFIQLRAKSTGETSQLSMKCPECGESTPVIIPLEEIQCVGSDFDPIIKISDEVTVEMKYPSYRDMPEVKDENEMAMNMIASSIKTVIYEDEKIDVADESMETVVAFLESMTQEQFAKITEFFQNTPTVKYDLHFVCKHCGHEKDIEIKGMQSFF